MKTKIFVSTVIAALLILCCVLPVGAAQRQDAQYTNPETSYQAIIIDDIDLLTESEEAKLIEEMTPLTEYGNIIFWSTDVHKTDYIDQARVKRRSLYDLDSAAILMINMNTRKVVIQSYGTMYQYITDSKARSITDNASHYARRIHQRADEVHKLRCDRLNARSDHRSQHRLLEATQSAQQGLRARASNDRRQRSCRPCQRL